MSKKNRARKKNLRKLNKVFEEQKIKKNNSLIFSGVILAMSSIGLLIFVLSEKIFHLN